MEYELIEVIAHHPNAKDRAFGMTFADDSHASAYARAMRRAGYHADVSPSFWTEPDAETALKNAANFFDDAKILPTA